MSPMEQRLRWWLENLGWIGVSGVTLVVFSMLGYGTIIASGQDELAQLEQDIAAEKQMSYTRQASAKASEQSANRNIDMLLHDFPRNQDISKALNKLYAAADNSNLILQRGKYKRVHNATGPFLRYEIELPLQGQYPEIQLFAYQALKEIPALALDDINFKRESANATLVQAKLHFTLYVLEDL